MSYKMQVFQNLKMVEKPLLIILLCTMSMANLASAQQKKTAKAPPIKKPKIFNYPPPPKAVKYETITVGASQSPSFSAPSTVAVSSEEAKYDREKICTDCDTLVLEPNKKHILIYDVKWMSNRESRTYREQPTLKDLDKDYYQLRGENLREWEELKANYPESEFAFHHIFRNTYIKTLNNSKQVLNLLNRQDLHQGFLFWDGKENDSTINRTRMALLTETVAKQTGLNKISSYYSKFKKDSLNIVNYQKTKSPSANVVANLNTFIMEEVFDEEVIPLQFFDLKKVSKITVQSQAEAHKKMIFKLNEKGQLVQFIDRKDTTTIIYKNNLPVAFKNRYNKMGGIYYHGDTVIFKDNNYLKISKIVNKTFIPLKTYLVDKQDYEKMTLDNGFENILSTKSNNTCLESYNDARETTIIDCYSNTHLQLPLTRTHQSSMNGHNFESKSTYSKEADKFTIENKSESRINKLEYTLADNKPTLISNFIKRGDADYEKPYVLNVTYEYYK